MCDNEWYSRKQCHKHITCYSCIWDSTFITTATVLLSYYGTLLVVEGLSSWLQTFSILLSISQIITSAFDGLLMMQASLLWDSGHASYKSIGQHFWHQFTPTISGPCLHRWPLWCSLNRLVLASGLYFICTTRLRRGWLDYNLFVCVCVCLRAKFEKRAT